METWYGVIKTHKQFHGGWGASVKAYQIYYTHDQKKMMKALEIKVNGFGTKNEAHEFIAKLLHSGEIALQAPKA